MSLELLSVNVGMGAVIGTHEGRTVRSGIVKLPVVAATISVGIGQLPGDQQVATSVHGGPDMAVYAYPADHFGQWAADLGRPVRNGLFGENLTVRGLVEDDVRVGDEWRWGAALLRVTKPRLPCYKLDLHLGRPVGDLMLAGRRTGWYLAVVEAGEAPTAGTIDMVRRGDGPTIAEVVARRAP